MQSIFSNKSNVESKDTIHTEIKKYVKEGDKHTQKSECTISGRQEDRPNKQILLYYGKETSRNVLREPCDSKRQTVIARNHIDDISINKVLTSEFISVRLDISSIHRIVFV